MKLYYTEDHCYLDNVIGVAYIIIDYAGKIIIEDNTPINYILAEHDQKLIIYQHVKGDEAIDNLFTYKGMLNISRCSIQYKSGFIRNIKIVNKKNKYISKNLNIKSEDMGLLSEEMAIKKSISVYKTKLITNVITHIDSKNRLYKKDGSKYSGLVHHHLSGSKKFKYYTGAEDSEDSELLYSKKPDNIVKYKPTSPTHKKYLQLLRNINFIL